MEDQLYKKKCIPCEGNIPAFDIKEIHKYLKKVNGWDVKENQDKSYKPKDQKCRIVLQELINSKQYPGWQWQSYTCLCE